MFFADDIFLLTIVNDVQESINKIKQIMKPIGLELAEDKTVILDGTKPHKYYIKYLGRWVNYQGCNRSEQIQRNLGKERKR